MVLICLLLIVVGFMGWGGLDRYAWHWFWRVGLAGGVFW
jgi:hypothetical protein